jgi:nucleolar complex protein 2
MAKKGSKATRKFAASGQLKKKIEARRKHQQIQKKVHKNKDARNKGKERARADEGEGEQEDAKEVKSLKKRHVVLISLRGRCSSCII